MRTLNRFLPSLVLLQWGGIIVFFGVSGRMSSFLHPNFRGFAMIAGVLLLITSLVLLLFGEEKECGDCCGHGDHEHHHETFGLKKWLSLLILVVPIGVAASSSPDTFSATLVEKRGMAESASSLPGVVERYEEQKKIAAAAAAAADLDNPYLKPNAAGNLEAEVVDLMYASEDPVMQKDYEGKRVELVGQFLPPAEKKDGEHSFKLLRLFMICCATDVQPLSVVVEMDRELPDFASMAWVKVTGVVRFEPAGNKHAAVIEASDVTPTDQPAEQYVY